MFVQLDNQKTNLLTFSGLTNDQANFHIFKKISNFFLISQRFCIKFWRSLLLAKHETIFFITQIFKRSATYAPTFLILPFLLNFTSKLIFSALILKKNSTKRESQSICRIESLRLTKLKQCCKNLIQRREKIFYSLLFSLKNSFEKQYISFTAMDLSWLSRIQCLILHLFLKVRKCEKIINI